MLFNQTVDSLSKSKSEYTIHEDIVIYRALMVAKVSVPKTTVILEKVSKVLKTKDIELPKREVLGVRSRINRKLQKTPLTELHDPKELTKADKVLLEIAKTSKDTEIKSLFSADELKK